MAAPSSHSWPANIHRCKKPSPGNPGFPDKHGAECQQLYWRVVRGPLLATPSSVGHVVEIRVDADASCAPGVVQRTLQGLRDVEVQSFNQDVPRAIVADAQDPIMLSANMRRP